MLERLEKSSILNLFICIFTIFFCIKLYSLVQDAFAYLPSFRNLGYYEGDTYSCLALTIIFFIIYRIFFYSKDREMGKKDYILILFIGLGIGGITLVYFEILDFMAKATPVIGESMEAFDSMWESAGESVIWILLSTVILGPIVEEIMFRGIIFKAAERVTKNIWFPIIVSGLAFGIWHWQPVQVGYTAIAGIIYGLIYSKKRSIKFTLAIHIINNLLSSFQDFTSNTFIIEFMDKLPVFFLIPAVFCIYLIATDRTNNA